VVYEDYRCGGEPQLILGNSGDAMRVPDEILKPVVFLFLQKKGDVSEHRRPIGTGFFVSVKSKTGLCIYPYLVTAKHCVVKAKEHGDLYIRINTTDGAAKFVKIEADWIFPEDQSSDLAVLQFNFPSHLKDTLDFRSISERMFCTAEKMKEHEIGIGDEIVISGLFTRLAEKPRNIPIVRFGNIAALPEERLADVNTGLSYRGFLAEVRSIGGISGSPVFAYLGPERVPPTKDMRPDKRFLMLIGIVRGHWRHNEPGIGKTGSAFSDELDRVNWGIGAITPISDLLEIIYGDQLMAERKELEDQLEAELAEQESIVNDSLIADEDEPLTRDAFESALKKVSRKIEPENK
jgi:hypothetical protein